MNKDLEIFENRSDDWLAKEREYENSVSAWDFDEGKRVKSYHEENCEARKIKEDHATKHLAYNKRLTNVSNDQFQELDGRVLAKVFIPMFIFIVAIGVIGLLVDLRIIGEDSFLAVPIILFIIFVNLIKKAKGKK